MTIGVSQEYEELSETREQYQNAVLQQNRLFSSGKNGLFLIRSADFKCAWNL